MNFHDQTWRRLAEAARRGRPAADETAPFGFSTRVAGLAMTAPSSSPWALFEKFAARGLIAACAFVLAAAAFGYSEWRGDRESDVASDDAVSDVLDLT